MAALEGVVKAPALVPVLEQPGQQQDSKPREEGGDVDGGRLIKA